ncbi:MAG: FAD-dependent oxidoreductase [Gammaproteobacteria bacterium]|nr:FAD-dependent oxidoreductase [Gammaproteobacteria bacterium]
MSKPQHQYLIIGQGLAGSILAYSLIKRGFRVMVVDQKHYRSSSLVAAGIINPITGHRFNISENFTRYYPVARRFYTQLEQDLGESIFSSISQLRLIKNSGQNEFYRQRLEQEAFREFIGDFHKTTEYFPQARFGATDVLQTAIVNTPILLDRTRNWLQHRDSYRATMIDYESITSTSAGWQVDGLVVANIIFCEGHQAVNNPWLNHLPFKLAKGEVLTMDIHQQQAMPMLNWGNWLVPAPKPCEASPADAHGASVKLGSNFDWTDLSLTPNAETHAKLLAGLQNATDICGRVNSIDVGIRPTTLRRKPFVGPLSRQENAYCFNGFGSKGCLLIPYYAAQMCQHLTEQKPLAGEVSQWL